MRRRQFRLGLEFLFAGLRWYCTGISGRAITAFCTEPAELATFDEHLMLACTPIEDENEPDEEVDSGERVDWSRAVRGPVIPPDPGTVRILLRLDLEVLEWFRARVPAGGGRGYQEEINLALRQYVGTEGAVDLDARVRSIVRDEFDQHKRSRREERSTRHRPEGGDDPTLAGLDATPRFAICVRNEGYTVSLERLKIYSVLPDTEAERVGWVRVIDESGEDYLYPGSRFVALPQEVVASVLERADYANVRGQQ